MATASDGWLQVVTDADSWTIWGGLAWLAAKKQLWISSHYKYAPLSSPMRIGLVGEPSGAVGSMAGATGS